MIASLSGKVMDYNNDSAIISVGGVGIEVQATRIALEQIRANDFVTLHTRLVVREESLTLFGFGSAAERDMFDVLLKVSGVGPRLAITILSSLSLDNLKNAVATERVEILTRVPGIGKKTAQKILIELKDKMPYGLDAVPGSAFEDTDSDVMDALVALGFSIIEAQTAIQALPIDAPAETDERIRLSLQYLSS